MPTLHILGGNSFIGKSVGCYINDHSSGSIEIALYNRSDIDLLDPQAVEDFFQRIESQDSILVAAAVSRLTDNSYQCFKQNCDIAENIARAIKHHECNYLIYLSSIDVYGQQISNSILNEHSLLAPEDYYAISKVAGENIIKMAFQNKPESLCIMRLTGIYGPSDSGKSLLGLFINRLKNNQGIILFSGGNSLRDYVYIDDLAELIRVAVIQKKQGLYNTASGIGLSIKTIAETTQLKVSAHENQLTINNELHRSYDLSFDTERLIKNFPSVSFRSIEQGILDYIENS